MKRTLALIVGLLGLLALAPLALGQARVVGPTYKAPDGVAMEVVLYPITNFRGNPKRIRENDEKINTPINVESIYLVRGVWQLCAEQFYYGRCVVVSGSQQAVNPPFPVRSARLIGDTGPTFVESPTSRIGSDAPLAVAEGQVENPRINLTEESRAPATPVVAPSVSEGGLAGTNTSLAGRDVQFYPAPAQGGRRVLACAQFAGLNPSSRCVQAAADGFCAAEGYRDSGWRESEVVAGKVYLVNVLCKKASDSGGARDSSGGGIRLPGFLGGGN